MGIFVKNDKEKEYGDLIKVVRSSDLDRNVINHLINYVNDIKSGMVNNPFVDFETLQGVILNIINLDINNYDVLDTLSRSEDVFKFLAPSGEKTPNFESIKREFVINFDNYIGEDFLFNREFYSLFETREDYLQVMNIIMNDVNLRENIDNIYNFGIELGKEIDDASLLKREIISYLHLYGSVLSSDEDYLSKRIDEARKRYGIYPGIDEKTLASISREIDKAHALIKKLELMEKRVDSYVSRVDAKTKVGISSINDTVSNGKKEIESYSSNSILKMQDDLANAKKDMLEELNKYIVELQSSLKVSSDKVFNQLLNDAKEKLDQIRSIASGLSTTTTSELLKIQRQTEESLDSLKKYVENSPELKESLKSVSENEEVKKALLEFVSREKEIVKASDNPGIIVPKQELVIPNEDFMVPTFEMTQGILHAFDRTIDFKERMKKIEEVISKLESEGYIIPPALREALPWYMMGKKIVYFYGPTQSGKTTVADLLAKVVQSELLDGGKITEDHSITSYNDVRGKFDENALFYALYYGKTVFYDELDNGNPDNLIVLGTFSSKLVNKIDNPNKDVTVQFAKRRFVPINANARIIAAGNTSGKGRNREYTSRSKLDESSLERLVPIYVGYSDEVEKLIFGNNKDWYTFFKNFREFCNNWARESSLENAEGNVTTGDASTIVEFIKEDSIPVSDLIRGLFVQTKENDYLAYLIKTIKAKYGIENVNEDEIGRLNNRHLSTLKASDIAKVFVYEANNSLNNVKGLIKKR